MLDWLRDSWDGVVMTDWGAGRHTERAGNAALDLIMPGPDGPWGEALVEAVRDGRVAKPRSTRSCGGCCGWPSGSRARDASPWSDERDRRRAASDTAAGIVLARDHGTLLRRGRCARSPCWPDAAVARTLGGGARPSSRPTRCRARRAAPGAAMPRSLSRPAFARTRGSVAESVAELGIFAATSTKLVARARDRRVRVDRHRWRGVDGDRASATVATPAGRRVRDRLFRRRPVTSSRSTGTDVRRRARAGPDADLGGAVAPPQRARGPARSPDRRCAVVLRGSPRRGFDLGHTAAERSNRRSRGRAGSGRSALAQQGDAAMVVILGTTPRWRSEGFRPVDAGAHRLGAGFSPGSPMAAAHGDHECDAGAPC